MDRQISLQSGQHIEWPQRFSQSARRFGENGMIYLTRS